MFCIPEMLIGGVESVFIQTLKRLSENKNFNITVVMQKKLEEPFYQEWFTEHKNIKLYILYPNGHIFERAKKYMPWFPLSNIRKIVYSLYKKTKNKQAIKRGLFNDCDIIIDYKNCSFAKILKNINKPKIAWIHGSINYFNETTCKQYFTIYDKIVCLTKGFMHDFQSQYPQHKNKITHIYNPIDIESIQKEAKKLPTFSGKYFCALSRLDHDTDIPTIIKAFNEFYAKENCPDVNLILIGYGDNAKALKQYANSLPCANKIIFTGATTKPFGYLKGALAHILSSHNEGLGMVLLESAACGTLNIASNCKNRPAEILLNGKAGILFQPGNSSELAKAMSSVWHNDIDCQAMKNLATTKLDRFNVATITKHIQDLILQTLNSKEANHAKNINCSTLL